MACDPCKAPCSVPEYPDPCDLLWPLLETIKDCLCTALEDSLAGAPCRCAIVQGQQAIIDECCAGFAWVRVREVYPSSSFPTRRGDALICENYAMAAQIEIGVARCAPTFDDQTGEAPSVEALEEHARVVQSDRVQMIRMLRCCVGEELGICKKLQIGSWTPIPEAGMCGGGTIQFAVPFNDYRCPPECDCAALEGE